MRTLVLMSVLVVIGCSQKQGLDTAPVRGSITLDGKPLTSGLITFWPEGGRTAKGTIQEDGTFTLGTYSEEDGAIIGMHKISITFVGKEPLKNPTTMPPTEYAVAETKSHLFRSNTQTPRFRISRMKLKQGKRTTQSLT